MCRAKRNICAAIGDAPRQQAEAERKSARQKSRPVLLFGSIIGGLVLGTHSGGFAAPSTHAPVLSPPAPAASAPRPVTPMPAAVTPIAGLSLALGDTIAKVRATYDIRNDAMKDCSASSPCLMLAAPLNGLKFFFKTDNELLYEVRADAPFSGSIYGVRIGDTLEELLKKFGQPAASPWGFGGNKAYLFRVHGIALRCDINSAGQVATIFYFND